jgi:hypothetical protein
MNFIQFAVDPVFFLSFRFRFVLMSLLLPLLLLLLLLLLAVVVRSLLLLLLLLRLILMLLVNVAFSARLIFYLSFCFAKFYTFVHGGVQGGRGNKAPFISPS